MKRIRLSRAARLISWVMTVVIIGLTPRLAFAQGRVGGSRVQTAIVVDFVDKTGSGNRRLASNAANAIAVELQASQQYDILSTKSVTDKANELGLRPPYDQVALSKIASDLGANVIISGEVAFVRIDNKVSPKNVKVGLRVRVSEGSTGDVLNGAAQIGESRARAGISDDDSMVAEALNNAAIQATRQIVTYTLPAGTVLNTQASPVSNDTTALVNVGSRDGIKPGQNLMVYRGGQRVGKLVVTAVFPTDSETKVIETSAGVRPEDKVRAVFPLPELDMRTGAITQGRAPGSRSPMASLGKVLVVLVVGIALYFAVSGGKNTTVTGVIAEPMIQNNAPAVRITWRDNIFGANTVEYHIWRNPDNPANEISGVPNVVSSLGQRQAFDFPTPFSFWDGTRGFLRIPQPTGTGGNNNQGNGISATETPAAGTSPGFVVGRTFTYSLTSVIRRQAVTTGNNGGGQGGGGQQAGLEDVGSDVVISGPATPINQPQIGAVPQDGATNIDIERFNPTWLSTNGADVFFVELSLDRNFSNRNAIVQLPVVFSTAPTANGVSQFLPAVVNLTTNPTLRSNATFLNFVNRVPGAPKPTIFIRVGGRSQADRPGPVHSINSGNASERDQTFRNIYSQVRSFQPAELPPPPP